MVSRGSLLLESEVVVALLADVHDSFRLATGAAFP